MSKQWKPRKETVELRPSRIRRDPVRVPESDGVDKVQWRTPEWEIKLAIIGIVAFAVAIDVIIVAISIYWN
ncbi:MAG TPA: hypothetical protein VFU80_01300 [Sphingomicrobium sp.]|nr:hypothetical protein [Sphingomicrobium sp.]